MGIGSKLNNIAQAQQGGTVPGQNQPPLRSPGYGTYGYNQTHGLTPHGQTPHGHSHSTHPSQQGYPAPIGATPYGQTHGQTPHGQTPYGQTPHGQTPHGQPPYGQHGQYGQQHPPYGQHQDGRRPSQGQTPYGYSQPPYGQPHHSQHGQHPPYGQPQHGQHPQFGQYQDGRRPSQGQTSHGQSHYGQTPHGQTPHGQSQPHGMGQPRPFSTPGGGAGPGKYYDQIYGHLSKLVAARQWQRFYPPDRLQRLAAEVSRHDYDGLAVKYGIPTEIVTELTKLSLVDVMFYCDDSASMTLEGRWDEDLQKIIETTVEICTMFDTDGVDVRFMNNQQSRDQIRSPADVKNLINSVRPNGLTPIGTQLDRKILRPYHSLMQQTLQSGNFTNAKPLLVICITDGEPQGESRQTLNNVILGMNNALRQLGLYGHEINYQFAQVGTDRKAQDFLDALDNDPQIGGFIDATSNYEIEADQFYRKNGGMMNPYIYMFKLLLGGVCPEWDEKD